MKNVKDITRIAFVAALYVVITLLCYPLAFDMVQFRLSEALVLLVFYRKDYAIGLFIGCVCVNWFSPLGYIDALVGGLATLIALIGIMHCKNIYIASIFPVISNGIIVGLELYFILDLPLIPSMLWVAFGEFVCVSIVGVILFKILERKEFFYELIKANQNMIKKDDYESV